VNQPGLQSVATPPGLSVDDEAVGVFRLGPVLGGPLPGPVQQKWLI